MGSRSQFDSKQGSSKSQQERRPYQIVCHIHDSNTRHAEFRPGLPRLSKQEKGVLSDFPQHASSTCWKSGTVSSMNGMLQLSETLEITSIAST